MNSLLILIPLSLLLVIVAVWAYLWAVGSGQFDDLETPAWDILSETEPDTNQQKNTGTSWPEN
ncbi:MAG: cbb3-type cytochrome oxidase assembly protein CcoS [Steroidobacteraceae bacterium]